MKVKCNNCGTKYEISDELLGEGKNVKCTYCDLVWFQKPQEENSILSEDLNVFVKSLEIDGNHRDSMLNEDVSNFSSESIMKNKGKGIVFFFMLFSNISLFFCIIFLLFFRLNFPFVDRFDYFMNDIGIWNSRLLELSDVNVDISMFKENHDIGISFDIYNPTSKKLITPYLQIRVKFANKYQDMVIYLLPDEKEIVHGQIILFKKLFSNFPDVPEEMTVKMMNFFEYKLRKIRKIFL